MTIEQEIVAWAKSRPAWQQDILRQLATSQPIDEAFIQRIATDLITGTARSVIPLTTAELPGSQPVGNPVVLTSVGDIQDINAIASDRPLTFSVGGLTVIYGDNASGKSGYARLLKALSGARHSEDILGNAFADGTRPPQKASVSFEVAGSAAIADWPDATTTALQSIHFYDEACGEVYLGGETELTYRPSVLVMLDELVAVCDAVRRALEAALQANDQARSQLPQVPDNTDASRLIARLNGSVLEAEIDAVAALPADAREQLASLMQEEARLQATDPTKEQIRLTGLASKVEGVARHVSTISKALNTHSPEVAKKARAQATQLRAAAAVASSTTFEDEPVAGVGTETWRALWEAARNFSQTEAYCGHDFPVTEQGRCVLCQQELSSEAAGRFTRFHAFMQDSTEQQARVAERQLADMLSAVQGLGIDSAEIATSLMEVEALDRDLANATTAWLRQADEWRAATLAVLQGKEATIPTVQPSPSARLEATAADLRNKASAIDATLFRAELQATIDRKRTLEGRIALSEHRPALTAEIRRLAERKKIVDAQQATDTGVITRKATELTRTHVTDLVKDRFTRESERLRLERITLSDAGGRKGRVRHRPALLGAKSPHPVKKVLSEGEQTALGLAGYFTEAYFDDSQSGMVLDDPVTSLDHIRRGRVAARLAEFARDRQVIVFTHDISFVGELGKAADRNQVGFTERSIQRCGEIPGYSTDEHPWKAKDVKARFQQLEQELARIKRDRNGWTQDEYEEACASWGGKLSETWERIISMEIVGSVVDRGTQEVRPTLFRLLAKITEQDDREFQDGYGRCSQWARRHDKSPETNHVAPEPEEMAQELTSVRAWFDRVKKYKN